MRQFSNIMGVTLFFVSFLISISALAQDLICPENSSARDRKVQDLLLLSDELNHVTGLTGYSSFEEAKAWCSQTIEEYNSKISSNYIEDYEGSKNQLNQDLINIKNTLEYNKSVCNTCLVSKRDLYEKKFIKKHGDHRYGTKGYRTRVVVVWDTAERIPTDKQAKYDLLYDEYMAEYDSTEDIQSCYKSTVECNEVSTLESKIKEVHNKLADLKKKHDLGIQAKQNLDQVKERCIKVDQYIENYKNRMETIKFLKSCLYIEKESSNKTIPKDTSPKKEQKNNTDPMNTLQKTNNMINDARSLGRSFGF